MFSKLPTLNDTMGWSKHKGFVTTWLPCLLYSECSKCCIFFGFLKLFNYSHTKQMQKYFLHSSYFSLYLSLLEEITIKKNLSIIQLFHLISRCDHYWNILLISSISSRASSHSLWLASSWPPRRPPPRNPSLTPPAWPSPRPAAWSWRLAPASSPSPPPPCWPARPLLSRGSSSRLCWMHRTRGGKEKEEDNKNPITKVMIQKE